MILAENEREGEGEREEIDHTGNLALIHDSLKILKSIFCPFIIFNKTSTTVSKNCFADFQIMLSNKAVHL